MEHGPDYRIALKLQPSHSTASKELDALLSNRQRASRRAQHDPRLTTWSTLFTTNLAAHTRGQAPDQAAIRAERDVQRELKRDPATRRLLRDFMRGFETQMGVLQPHHEDGGSDSESDEEQSSSEEGGGGAGSEEDEWETDEEEDVEEPTMTT